MFAKFDIKYVGIRDGKKFIEHRFRDTFESAHKLFADMCHSCGDYSGDRFVQATIYEDYNGHDVLTAWMDSPL